MFSIILRQRISGYEGYKTLEVALAAKTSSSTGELDIHFCRVLDWNSVISILRISTIHLPNSLRALLEIMFSMKLSGTLRLSLSEYRLIFRKTSRAFAVLSNGKSLPNTNLSCTPYSIESEAFRKV